MVTRGYKRLQGIQGVTRGLQGVTGITGGYRGKQGVATGLQRVTVG